MIYELKLLISENTDELINEAKKVFSKFFTNVVFVKKNGAEILETINNIQPEIVILDYDMSKVDAIEIINKVKKNENLCCPMFIVISNDSNVEKKIIKAGAAYFITKPFKYTEIVEKILQYIEKNAPKNKMIFELSENEKNKKLCDLEIKISDILHQVGIPTHVKGYRYLRNSILLSIETPEIINAITKKLYPLVAENFSTTSSRVERAIRHAIELAWECGDTKILNTYFAHTVRKIRSKPTNSEFIAAISDRLSLLLKK